MTGHRWNLPTNICDACGVTKQDIAERKANAICCTCHGKASISDDVQQFASRAISALSHMSATSKTLRRIRSQRSAQKSNSPALFSFLHDGGCTHIVPVIVEG